MSTVSTAHEIPLLDRKQVLRELGISFDTLRRLEITGQLVAKNKIKCPITGLWKKVYEPADVERIKQARVAPRPARIIRPEGAYLLGSEARARLTEALRVCRVCWTRFREAPRVTRGKMIDWNRVGCPALGGMKLTVLRAPPEGKSPQNWFLEREIDEIIHAWQKFDRGQYEFSDGIYLTYLAVETKWKFAQAQLSKLERTGDIRTREIVHPFENSPLTLFREQDLRERLNRRVARWDGKRVLKWNGCHEEGNRLTMTAASKRFGIDRRQLWKYTRKCPH